MKHDNASKQPAGYGTSAKAPAGATASDMSGERHGKVVNGVGMGKADATGGNHAFDGGRCKGVCYTHERKSYQK
jgi:hypothetical protein